jgi:hypothetical protein
MNLELLATLWAVMFASLVVLTFIRWSAGRNEDDRIHALDSDMNAVRTQSATAHRLDLLDRWNMILLVGVFIFGLVVGGLYLYGIWLDGLKTHF